MYACASLSIFPRNYKNDVTFTRTGTVHIPNRHFIKPPLRTSALPVRPPVPSEAAAISCDDANVIKYAAGYVCRKIHKSIHRSSKPDQAELLRCVKSLLKEDDDEEAQHPYQLHG